MATEYPAWVEEIRVRLGKKALLSIPEAREILGRSKDYLYERLADGSLVAHNPEGIPGKNGTKIVTRSLLDFLAAGEIKKEKWID